MNDQLRPADETAETVDERRIKPAAPADAAVPGRLATARAHAVRTRDDAGRRVTDLRTRNELVDAALEAGDLDRRRAGSLLAGGIAFRVFLWLLPAALFTAGLLGLFQPSGSAQPEHVARKLGLGASVAAIVRQATKQSHKAPVALLGI